MTVEELGARLSAREELEWAILYKLEREAQEEAEMDRQLMQRHAQRAK